MKRTNKFQLGYFEQDDFTSPITELQRWETLDAQLFALFSVLGNGILSGWDLVTSSGLNITISAGSGHVAFVAVESIDSFTIEGLSPNSTMYIYAEIQADSYWTKEVNFAAYASYHETNDESLYLGSITTDDVSVTTIDLDGRKYLGFQHIVNQIVADHRHIGGTGNPDPIDLSSEVQGVLNQQNIPDLDASKISTGILDENRIPEIDHITGLLNQGTLTHAQLDAIVEGLSIDGNKSMGEISTINLLQLILSLKHVYPDIDEYLVNEIAFIPGISPDSYVDTANTTAEVDYRTFAEGGTHTISMTPVSGLTAYSRVWDSNDDFTDSTKSNVYIGGDSVFLDTTVDTFDLDDFSDISDWTVYTENLSSTTNTLSLNTIDYVQTLSSGQLTVGSQETEMALVIKKSFDAQDWSSYTLLTFYIKTDSVDHGDIIFYIKDSVSGIQNSYNLILNRNTPTINIDTLENGWQEITVDISPYTRTSISEIALYTSTQIGWDNSKQFDLKIDQMTLSTGNYYYSNGYVRVIYGGDLLLDFWRLRWDAIIPSDSQSTGVNIKFRTRIANTEIGLSTATWSSYMTVSGTELDIPDGVLYKYIEIEAYLEASISLTRTPCLKKIYLDFYVNDTDASFEFDTKSDWETGKLFNIDTSESGYIKVANVTDIGTHYFASSGSVGNMDSNFDELFSFTGTNLPISTNQVLLSEISSLGYISGIARGDKGAIWLADTDNDRIVKVDKYGNLIVGFYGSFLQEPSDPYGTEDNGTGSNTNVSFVEENLESTELNVLHSIYNKNEGVLYIVFDQYLEDIYGASTKLNLNKIYLKIGAHKFNLSDSTVELVGLPEEKYNLWKDIISVDTEATTFINQFSFKSHILKITILGSDKIALNSTIGSQNPTISIGSPYQNYRTKETSMKVNFIISGGEISDSQYGIRLSIDGNPDFIIREDNYTFTSLTNGLHTVTVQLVDDSDVDLDNDESFTTLQFTKYTSYNNPYLSIVSPKPNQVYSGDSIILDFKSENFPVLPTGQHIRYQIDGDFPIDYYSTEPLKIEGLEAGKHSIRIYTVDSSGNDLEYTYGDISVDFIIGQNYNSVLKLYMDNDAIYDYTGSVSVTQSRSVTDIANIYFRNIYSPIDIQLISNDVSGLAGDETTLLVSKLRSQSWLDGMSGEENAKEIAVRAENVTRLASNLELLSVNEDLVDISTNLLIFNSYYLNGHSVVQINESGETVFSNNAAKFAESKEDAKNILGSAEKIGASELLIGDSINKRAIIVYTDLDTQKPEIEWQYDSDKYVVDFHMVPQEDKVIEIFDDSIDESEVFIRQGTTIIWKNSSSIPITIYSGTTTYDLFEQDPDLNLYGDIFVSPVIEVGETYTFTFVDDGEFDWFVYPDILTGKINVTRQRISSRDLYYILESDGLDSPFTSRVIKVDSWGNILWSFGESYLVKPRDIRPMLNGNILLST